jgi:hypothetical protein
VGSKAKVLMSFTPPINTQNEPLFFYTSCCLPPEDLYIAPHLSTDSFLHVKHLAELYKTNSIVVLNEELAESIESLVNLFSCVDRHSA